MKTQRHALQAAAKRLSGFDRRRTLGAVMAAVGAVAVSAGVISQPATADGSYTCPVGTEADGLVFPVNPPSSIVTVGNWPAVYVGIGLEDGTHVQFGDGVTLLNNQTFDVSPDLAIDYHMCKLSENPPTTTAAPTTTTTQPEQTTTTVEQTTTTVEQTTTTVEQTTTTVEQTTTTVEQTTTTQPEQTTTTQPEQTTTTQPEQTTTTSPEQTTTTSSDIGGPTTTTTIPDETTTTGPGEVTTTTVPDETTSTSTTVAIFPPTTTAGSVSQELPRTGTDSARALMTFGSLMMLMGGVLVLRSRRDVEFG